MNRWKRLAALAVLVSSVVAVAAERSLHDPAPLQNEKMPAGYTTSGGVSFGYLGDRHRDNSEAGFILQSGGSGSVSTTISNLDAKKQKWYRFTFRGLAGDGFVVGPNDLMMKVAFFGDHGRTSYDEKGKPLYSQIETARRDLSVNGKFKANGAEVWQTYAMVFSLPFPQVDTVKLSVDFKNGRGDGRDSVFFVSELALTPIAAPASDFPSTTQPASTVALDHLLPIGGRWFYAANAGETGIPKKFDATNADRLIYHDNTCSAPFAGNMSAYLRPGMKDAGGNVVSQFTLLKDNVTVAFDTANGGGSMIVHSHNIPNHPVGVFPEPGFGNPSYIAVQNETYYFPLNPQENPQHRITDESNGNRALHMGPIGIAVNGVVFFNPFDMGNTDATNLMDRCCGHPNQDDQYHYHKYPICMNSPWSDEGQAHSPLIGFAFDGYPVYGPYESKDTMAMNVVGEHALNGFNMHYDAERGWHYHVTPGKFPYLIGGFWGVEDPRNRPQRHGPPNGGGGNGRPGMTRGRGPGGRGQGGGGPGGPADGPPNGFPPPR